MAYYPLSQLAGDATDLPGGTPDQRMLEGGAPSADNWFASQGAPGPDSSTPGTRESWIPSGAGGALQAPTGQPPTDRAGITQWVTQQLAQYGIQPGPRGSGVGDVEYWTDQVLDPVNTGYSDWAGRIQRGAQGTQPPLAGGGGGGAFGTGVDYGVRAPV